MASISARRIYRQKPTPVGMSGYVGTAVSRSARAMSDGSRSGGHALFSQNRGKEQISALFENGVIVPIRVSDAAQRARASSQPWVTMVSEFKRTTSAAGRAHARPRFEVRVNPRFL